MFSIRRFPAAVVSLLLAGCLSAQEWREPTADELHELSLEELLQIPIEAAHCKSNTSSISGLAPVASLCAPARVSRDAEGGE